MPAVMSDQDLLNLLYVVEDPETGVEDGLKRRSTEWIEQTLRVREAQRTKSRTAHHRDLMAAYDAAVAEWEAYREAHSNGHRAEMDEYERDHPRPTLKGFMMDHRPARTAEAVCPSCGFEFQVEAS